MPPQINTATYEKKLDISLHHPATDTIASQQNKGYIAT